MTKTNTQAAGMTYPCPVRVRAMGLNEDDFDAVVVEIIRRHCPELGEGAVQVKPSKTGKYLSVNVDIQAQSREHLEAIYDDLTAHEKVLMRL